MPQRTVTGHHTLLPAANSSNIIIVPLVPQRTFIEWSLGRGTAVGTIGQQCLVMFLTSMQIWRIWPAVLMHTAFAALVVSVSLRTRFTLGVPNVLLTLLGEYRVA